MKDTFQWHRAGITLFFMALMMYSASLATHIKLGVKVLGEGMDPMWIFAVSFLMAIVMGGGAAVIAGIQAFAEE